MLNENQIEMSQFPLERFLAELQNFFLRKICFVRLYQFKTNDKIILKQFLIFYVRKIKFHFFGYVLHVLDFI